MTDNDAAVVNSILETQEISVGILDLTATPCSFAEGTTTRNDGDGYAERLVDLMEQISDDHFRPSISIQADHYYQRQGVVNVEVKSIAAVKTMIAGGIEVAVHH